jgi:hypothetical protein
MYCALGSQYWTCNLQKFFLGSCIHLLDQKFFLCIEITYFSLFLSNLFRSTLSFDCALVSKLGQHLLNIPRFILSKKKFPLILPLLEQQVLRSYLFSSNPVPFLALNLTSQVEYYALKQHIYAQSFLFSLVPNNHSFRS